MKRISKQILSLLSISILSINSSLLNAESYVDIRNIEALNSSADDFAPQLYKNTLFFNSERSGKSLFYTSQLGKTFSEVQLAKGKLNSPDENQAYIYFETPSEAIISKFTQFDSRSNLNLYKVNYNHSFSSPVPINNIRRNNFISQVSSTHDSKYYYFVADLGDIDKNTDIYYTLKTDYFNEYSPLSEICSPESEITPFLKSIDTLYFASNGLGGKGGFDIFRSVCIDGVWQRPQAIDELNTEYDESDFIIINDTMAVFASNRPGGKGGLDLYAASIKRAKSQPATTQVTKDVMLHIHQFSDEIVSINKNIIRTYEQTSAGINLSEKVQYEFQPKQISCFVEHSDNFSASNISLYANAEKVDTKLSISNNQIDIDLSKIDAIKSGIDELVLSLEIEYNGGNKSQQATLNINENEAISYAQEEYKSITYKKLMLTDLSKDAIAKVVDYFSGAGLSPQVLLLNRSAAGKSTELKEALSKLNKKISVELTDSKTTLLFK